MLCYNISACVERSFPLPNLNYAQPLKVVGKYNSQLEKPLSEPIVMQQSLSVPLSDGSVHFRVTAPQNVFRILEPSKYAWLQQNKPELLDNSRVRIKIDLDNKSSTTVKKILVTLVQEITSKVVSEYTTAMQNQLISWTKNLIQLQENVNMPPGHKTMGFMVMFPLIRSTPQWQAVIPTLTYAKTVSITYHLAVRVKVSSLLASDGVIKIPITLLGDT